MTTPTEAEDKFQFEVGDKVQGVDGTGTIHRRLYDIDNKICEYRVMWAYDDGDIAIAHLAQDEIEPADD